MSKLEVYGWPEFWDSFFQKWITNLASVKVCGLIWSFIALVFHRISGGEFVTIWITIYGIREVWKTVSLRTKKDAS